MVQQATQLVSHQQEEARSAVECIGAFAAAARAQQLKPNVRQLFKRNILDSLGCAIAALSTVRRLDAQPISALMDLLAQVQPTAVYPRTRGGI